MKSSRNINKTTIRKGCLVDSQRKGALRGGGAEVWTGALVHQSTVLIFTSQWWSLTVWGQGLLSCSIWRQAVYPRPALCVSHLIGFPVDSRSRWLPYICIWKDLQPHLDCTGVKSDGLSLQSKVLSHADWKREGWVHRKPGRQQSSCSVTPYPLPSQHLSHSSEKGEKPPWLASCFSRCLGLSMSPDGWCPPGNTPHCLIITTCLLVTPGMWAWSESSWGGLKIWFNERTFEHFNTKRPKLAYHRAKFNMKRHSPKLNQGQFN